MELLVLKGSGEDRWEGGDYQIIRLLMQGLFSFTQNIVLDILEKLNVGSWS